jgi:hypothetical protein
VAFIRAEYWILCLAGEEAQRIGLPRTNLSPAPLHALLSSL